eukprot:TRINITY_DN67668_c3_g2_i1.p1 TRINITY_DN67668_c3_g2~~TRINITY_DN67668_c3_g2_i1.p1  ORF type:complete len:246 (+),score=28.78 TRINITY_DN67668_c3_g2_i1:45-740(+)
MVEAFMEVCKTVNKRGIFCGGWTELKGFESTDQVLLIPGAPHEWLFPQCCMAIHHGGAGTTAASLRAGIPTIVNAVLIDQPFWASRVITLGVGQSQQAPLKGLSKEVLEQEIKHCLEPAVVEKAKQLGENLRAENGCENTAKLIRDYISLPGWNQTPEKRAYENCNEQQTKECSGCSTWFSFFNGKKKCHACGHVFCGTCAPPRKLVNYSSPVACCGKCHTARDKGLVTSA